MDYYVRNLLTSIIIFGIIIIALQIYISMLFSSYETSKVWRLFAFVICFGLTVYCYQILKFEKRAGYSYEKLTASERKLWRKIYTMVLLQYLLLFALFGWISSPL
ncbi:hypothetical protein [Bacillus toyonensis]|uniref:hypothetical protein n=1 Tax=Bacillus toyonensis TaxID=155322 RepID=UPI002E1BCDBF|nr:hypothetical protein [Bacillus toyonensis]